MRITSSMLSNTILKNISASYERVVKYESQLSSGKKVNKPSDDPVALERSLNVHELMKELDQHTKNTEDAISWLNANDAALRNATDLMHRTKELAVRGANGLNAQTELDAIASEVDQILSQMVTLGNTAFGDRHIFAGHKTTTPAFDASGNYNGDSGNINYEIEKGVSISINLPGNSVFKGSTDVFTVLTDLRNHLQAGDYAAISKDTSKVDDALSVITDSLVKVGVRTNRLEFTLDRHMQDKINLTQMLDDVDNVDIAEVVMKLKMEENVYQASLITGSSAMRKSLIDFLM